MKAKDYAIKYNELLQTTNEEETQFQIVKMLVNETRNLTMKRGCKTVGAYLAVMREMQQNGLLYVNCQTFLIFSTKWR